MQQPWQTLIRNALVFDGTDGPPRHETSPSPTGASPPAARHWTLRAVGKTAFALNVATHAATKASKKVAFFSLEMPSEQLALRMLASEAKLDWRRLSAGQLSSYDWQKIQTHGDRICRASIWIDDNFVLTPVELRSKCRKLRRENGGLDLVVVDYLQLMHAPSDRTNQSREQEIATISRSLKSLAKELECPVVALSQLNRGVEKRKGDPPMLSDLRESGAIEQDADVVLFLHRNDEDSKDAQAGAAPRSTRRSAAQRGSSSATSIARRRARRRAAAPSPPRRSSCGRRRAGHRKVC